MDWLRFIPVADKSDERTIHLLDGGDVRGTNLPEIVTEMADNGKYCFVLCGKMVFPGKNSSGDPTCEDCIKKFDSMKM